MTQRNVGNTGEGRRTPRLLIRRPYPTHSLEDSLAAAQTIREANRGQPFAPDLLAAAMGTTRGSSAFRMKLTSSVKYGLTEGGVNDAAIALTPLGEAAVAPKSEEERRRALAKAACTPDVFGQFYANHDGKALPRDDYSRNMLEREWNIHDSISEECIGLIKANGQFVGILSADANGALRVDLGAAQAAATPPAAPQAEGRGEAARPAQGEANPPAPSGRVFLGYHGESEVVDFLRELLMEFAIPFADVDGDTNDALPVSGKVSQAMQECNSAILVLSYSVGDDAMNRMRYQVGAASVLYGPKLVILSEHDPYKPDPFPGLPTVTYSPERPEDVALTKTWR